MRPQFRSSTRGFGFRTKFCITPLGPSPSDGSYSPALTDTEVKFTWCSSYYNFYKLTYSLIMSNRIPTPISVVEIVRSVRPFELFSLPDSPELHLCVFVSPAQTLLLHQNVGKCDLCRHFGHLLPIGVCRLCHCRNAVHQFGSTSFRKQIQDSSTK